ncbi:MAG TPA: TetR/AcrR family transcriptional regulator [Microlunatus sp.]|nr:TetR/AcrR family transcriptional regulator [Microlunatus sp.]
MRKRNYDSPLRTAQSAGTRRRIVAAATAEFTRHGYAKTSVAGIAAAAGVSRETVYHVLGNKQAVLKACWDVAVVGDDEPVPVAERAAYRSMLAEPDPTEAAKQFGQLSAGLVGRIGPLLRVVADAAHEPELAELLAQTRDERLQGTRQLLATLSGAAPATPRFAHVVDVVYALVSPELALVLIEQRRWTLSAYGDWLGEQVAAQVLGLRGDPPGNRSTRL